jgi:hypothetical protein
MNTIEDQIDSTETGNRWRPVLDRPTPAEPRDPVASKSVEAHSNRIATVVHSHSAGTWARRLAGDANSSNLVNFPFAFTAFTLLTAGLITICCGMAVMSAWLTVVGFLLTLTGTGLYGGSLSDD